MPSARTKASTDKAHKQMKKPPRATCRVAEIPKSFVEQIVRACEHGNLSTEELQHMIVEFNKEEERKEAAFAEIRRTAREDRFLDWRVDA